MGKPYERPKAGERLGMHGMDLVNPPDGLRPGKFAYAQNVRAYVGERTAPRAQEGSSVMTLGASVHSLRRLNDLTPAGPPLGYVLIGGAAGILYANGVQVASGLSGNPLSLIPFRPAASVQPWMYVGDSATSGVFIDSSTGSTAVPNGMLKVRSDGLCYSMGIEEPQAAPTITSVPVPSASAISLLGQVQVQYWLDSPHSGPVAQYIWRNAGDTSGTGPIRSSTPPAGTSAGNSLLFNVLPLPPGYGLPQIDWTQYQVYNGTVNIDGTGVNITWVNGSQFEGLSAGDTVIIGTSLFTIAASPAPTNTTFSITTAYSPAPANDIAYQAVAVTGTVPMFTPATNNINMAVTGTFYIPEAGDYTITVLFKDDVIWGIGNSATGQVSLVSYTGGSYFGQNSFVGQTETAINAYPLLPRNPNEFDGGGGFGEDDVFGGSTVVLNFSEPGNYPFEFDWDWWYHNFPQLTVLASAGSVGAGTSQILPISQEVITEAQYRYTYRSSATGATSNPSPESMEQTLSVLANTLVAVPSTDPQVDKIDWYRLDTGLLNYTYVGTGPNSNAPFSDTLLDTDVAANPILEFDNYQPFPSIDLPRAGIVDVTNGVVTWVSGNQFNVRWLPGTVIIVGTVAFTLDKRPTSALQLTCSNVTVEGGVEVVVVPANGTNVVYEIAEPILAAQPLPYLFGPTDNINFIFGVGDPLRPGTLYWCKGNDLDSAPDTNQQDITTPSEELVNGAMSGGRGVVFSTERAWLILPNFFNALATVQGTVGSTWTLQESSIDRGLYIPKALAMEASGNIFFRVKDGIHVSRGGAVSKSITDDDIYNLFSHEGQTPQPVTRGGYTVWPPNDNVPQYQSMECADGYLYYDYLDVNGFYRTLVYDIKGEGWVVDQYQYPARIHRLEEGGNVNGTLVGCSDGSVRPLVDSGVENACAIVLTRCETASDLRALKHWGDVYIECE
jgi:hypothetical protein